MKVSLLLLPGLVCDEAAWKHQIAALGDIADCTVLDWTGLDSLTAMAERVLKIAPAKFALAGHSMGGRVAFEVYRLGGERVSHLALLDTHFTPRPTGEAGKMEEQGRYALLELARSQGMGAMCRQWVLGMVPEWRRNSDPELVEYIVKMFERRAPADYENQIRALLNRPNAEPVLAAIRAKTLVLTGVEDRWSPPSAHEQMHSAISNSALVLIPKCGHMSTLEQPESVNAAFREWLR